MTVEPAHPQPRSRWLDRLHRLLDSPLGAIAGGLLYGSWAFWANHLSAGTAMALRIALAHAAMSTFLTLFGVKAMNRLFKLGHTAAQGALIACLGSLLLTYVLLIGVHTYLRTPHILLTLAPGLLPTLSFCLSYSLLLWRQARLQHNDAEDHADEAPTLVR